MTYRPLAVGNGTTFDTVGDPRIGAAAGDIPQASVADLTTDLAAKLASAGGKVLQTVAGTNGAETVTTSTTYVNTNHTVTITPSATANKVLVIATGIIIRNNVAGASTFVRLFRGTVSGTAIGTEQFMYTANAGQYDTVMTVMVLDSPSTTSAQTYTMGVRSSVGTNTAVYKCMNIVAMEVSA